jgi:hypothetical protein
MMFRQAVLFVFAMNIDFEQLFERIREQRKNFIYPNLTPYELVTTSSASRLEIRAVNATALIAAEFVNQRKFKCTIVVACRAQFRYVYVVAEAKCELVVVETSGKDEGVHKDTFLLSVGNPCPKAEMNGLVVAEIATAATEHEFQAGA